MALASRNNTLCAFGPAIEAPRLKLEVEINLQSVWTCNVARKDKATVQQVDTSPRDSEAFDLSVEEEGLALASLQNVEVRPQHRRYWIH